MRDTWNPWHGCRKYSEGCAHCYVYRRDAMYGLDSTEVRQTADFNLPVRRHRDGSWKIPSGAHIYACMTSDFFLEDADRWRDDAWGFINRRSDVTFSIITKRILRAADCLPMNWGEGYPNVRLGLTCENQGRADERMDAFLALPVQNRFIVCEPMLGKIDLSPWLARGGITCVIAGGESGPDARPLYYEWVLALRDQCAANQVRFHFKQTGANFVKDGRRYRIERRLQSAQAKRAGIDWQRTEGDTSMTRALSDHD